MDITASIIWSIVWLVLTFGVTWLTVAAFGVLSLFVLNATESATALWITFVGYVLGFAWFVFAAIQTVLQVIRTVQAITGSPVTV